MLRRFKRIHDFCAKETFRLKSRILQAEMIRISGPECPYFSRIVRKRTKKLLYHP